jgi:Rieske Fe-S protein
MKSPRPALSRREFLLLSAGAAAAGALPGCATVPVVHSVVRAGRVSLAVEEFDAKAGERSAVALTAPGLEDPILLIRTAAGEYRAVSSRCTHQGCRVKPARGFLICPCHGSTYDLDGNVLRGPAQEPLPAYSATVDRGRIEISTVETRFDS